MSTDLKTLHTDFLEELEIGQGRSQKTIENYDHYLQRFYAQQKVMAVADITADRVRAFRRYLSESVGSTEDTTDPDSRGGLALATQNYHLIALRQFLKYLARRDIEALAAEKVGLAKVGERDIDVLYPEEIEALLAAPQELDGEDIATLRDTAILQTLFATGVRISELVRLNRDDVRKENREIPVRGKGNKVRVVFLSPASVEAISRYVELRTDIDPALFIRHKKGSVGPKDTLRITPRSVQRLIKKYAALAGLTKNITPHTLRHSFATDLLSNGADVRQVQQLLGHASITTTQIYTHLTDSHLRDVHEEFHRKATN